MKNISAIHKILMVSLLAINTLPVFSQQIYFAKESYVRFFSNAPLEDIVAINKNSKAALNTQNNEVAIKIDMKRFEFPNKLMQEHFNENYLETNTFPYATFKGKINKEIDWSKPQNTSVSVLGEMNVHGVQKMLILDGRLFFDPQTKSIIIDTNFKIALSDYGIEVPSILFTKIAENIEVNVQFKLSNHTTKNSELAFKPK